MVKCGMCPAEFTTSGGLTKHVGAKHKPDLSVEALAAAANRKGSLRSSVQSGSGSNTQFTNCLSASTSSLNQLKSVSINIFSKQSDYSCSTISLNEMTSISSRNPTALNSMNNQEELLGSNTSLNEMTPISGRMQTTFIAMNPVDSHRDQAELPASTNNGMTLISNQIEISGSRVLLGEVTPLRRFNLNQSARLVLTASLNKLNPISIHKQEQLSRSAISLNGTTPISINKKSLQCKIFNRSQNQACSAAPHDQACSAAPHVDALDTSLKHSSEPVQQVFHPVNFSYAFKLKMIIFLIFVFVLIYQHLNVRKY